jgi:hypothetical protein
LGIDPDCWNTTHTCTRKVLTTLAEKLRKRYLTVVPTHARVLELSRAWLGDGAPSPE